MTGTAVMMLLLLAWHFSIQAAAHQATLIQVRTWMKDMGATAGDVQFRLLRGALTIRNVKATLQGNPLEIEYLFLKGNPASITSHQPTLQHIDVENITLNAQVLSQSWQDLSFNLPASLQTIFRHAKQITFHQGIITHLKNSPDLHLQRLHISGPTNNRQIQGFGFSDNPNQTWQLNSKIPENTAETSGEINANDDAGKIQLQWTGAWQAHNMKVTFERTTAAQSSIKAVFKQENKHWTGDIHTRSWPIDFNIGHSNITGHIEFLGTPKAWQMKSDKIQWDNTSFSLHKTTVQSMLSHRFAIDNKEKTLSIKRLDIQGMAVQLETNQPILPSTTWLVSAPNINIQALNTTIMVANEPIYLPLLSGTAHLQNQALLFDVSSPADEHQFWRIQGYKQGLVHVSGLDIPLWRLRNLMPHPIQEQALTMQGITSLDLNVIPHQAWSTTGTILISDLTLASEDQSFKAQALQLEIQQANDLGVQQATMHAKQWDMAFPLTPRQAWSDNSHLDEWAKIPWAFQDVTFQDGKITMGHEKQVWVQHAQLHVQNWQTASIPATLQLAGDIDLAPIQASMSLQQNEAKTMQWQHLKLNIRDANMFNLLAWASISKLPQIEKGHLTLSVEANQINHAIQGHADLTLDYLHLIEPTPKENYLQQQLGYPTQRVIQQLSNNHVLNISNDFLGTQSWDTLMAQALLVDVQDKLAQPTISNHDSEKNTREFLGSVRIHKKKALSHNERTRLRKMIKVIKKHKHAYVELTPDLGTAKLNDELLGQIRQTQSLIKLFLHQRGIKLKQIYTLWPQEKHHSTRDVGAIHINLVK